jgi:hypothetical protein
VSGVNGEEVAALRACGEELRACACRRLDRCSSVTPPLSTQPRAPGLWLFSRKPVDPEAAAVMRSRAAALGYDLSVLKPVTQAGCTYPATK